MSWQYPSPPPTSGAAGGPPPAPPPGWGSPGAPQPGRPRRGRAALVGFAVGFALVIGVWIGSSLPHFSFAPVEGRTPLRPVPQPSSAAAPASGAIDAQAISRKVDPAVVNINTAVATLGQSAHAAGTGMVLTSSGQVLTNNHVVEGAKSIRVTIGGSSASHPATVVGVDPPADVALLQVQGVSGLPTVTMADSSSLRVGEPVVAIGNALGQGGSPTVTTGAITALNRSITASDDNGNPERLTGVVQIDAPIVAGDSGGPLVNSDGQVVGMITAGAAEGLRRSTSTVGFAIPSNSALGVVNQIRAGKAGSGVILGQPGYLGVAVRDLDPMTATQLGLDASAGALVVGVVPGSPAASAGIDRDAVITNVDGTTIDSSASLGPAIQNHKPGQQVQVTWVDQAGKHTAGVTLMPGPAA
jgi:S1-C subfamily serine protease